MGTRAFVLIFQHSSLCCVRFQATGVVIRRNLHYTAFIQTRDSDESGQQLSQPAQQDKPRHQSVGSSSYGAVMDSARSQSQLSNREQFSLVLKEFMSREKYRKGHVSFINMALARMEEFQLERDLLTYNRILDVFPKGRYKPKRLLDALWPRPLPQTELALELLTRMEDHNVWPDSITYSLLVEVFGKHSLPVEKCERMAYWYSRYKDADPYWIEGGVPSDPAELSLLALRRIVCNDDIVEYEISPSGDNDGGFILSGHSDHGLQLLERLGPEEAGESCLLHVEGPHRIWINKSPVQYFSLRLAPTSGAGTQTDEGPVVAVCACQPATQISLQRWLGELQHCHPQLTNSTILYNIRTQGSSSPLLGDSQSTLLGGNVDEKSTMS